MKLFPMEFQENMELNDNIAYGTVCTDCYIIEIIVVEYKDFSYIILCIVEILIITTMA